MDTRNKIIDEGRARETAARGRVRAVVGYFDPLLAAHAARFREIRGGAPGEAVMALVLDPPEPLLELRARAELVAALADVDYVVPLGRCGPQAAGIPDGWLDETGADRERTRNLIEYVHRRHTS